MTYSEKLRSPHWQKKRLQILERDGWKCLFCGATEKNLQVYHLLFQKRDPWDYPDELYQTMCEDCYRERQALTDKAADILRLAIKNVPTERLQEVARKLAVETIGGAE